MATELLEASLADIARVTGIETGDTVVAFGLHPDDLGMFHTGAIDAAVALGAVVHVITVTNGEQSTKGDPAFVAANKRLTEAQAEAAVLLGEHDEATQEHYLHMPDIAYYYDKRARVQLRDRFKDTLAAIMPKVIFGPGFFGGDGHPAHAAGHETMIEARDALGSLAVVWGLTAPEDATLFVPVNSYRKHLALAQSKSQFPNTIDADGTIRFEPEALDDLVSPYYNELFEAEWYDAA